MLKEFKEFLMRGNVVDLAVAVIIGAAFKAIVDSLVKAPEPKAEDYLREIRDLLANK